MIIKASQRGGYRNLANHLTNTQDNDHVTLYETRGMVGNSLHAALAEIDAVSQGTRCRQPMFSVSFNPPEYADVTHEQFEQAFEKLEAKLGLENQPRAVVFHEKEGRRHCHVVWSRILIDDMKAINMSYFKEKCTDVSRELFREHGWDMPRGLVKKEERDPYGLTNAEWQRLKRIGVDPKSLKSTIRDAWQISDNLASFKHALKERGLFLAKGDRRNFVVLDHTEKVFSLSKKGGITTKELKNKLVSPDGLPSVAMAAIEINSLYNTEMMKLVKDLKAKQNAEMLPLKEQKALMVAIQRAERQELKDRHRVKRNLTAKSARDSFRKGIMGLFDKVTGKERRLRLIGRKALLKLKGQQSESRQKLIFRHNADRAELQKPIVELRETHLAQRQELAKRILELRSQNREQSRGRLAHSS